MRRGLLPRWMGKFEMKMFITLVSVAVLATAAGAEPNVVVEPDIRPTLRVAYEDLNLRSERGRERLNKRVTAAVRSMCRDDNLDPLVMELAEQRCYAAAIRDANDQIDRLLEPRPAGFAGRAEAADTLRR